MVLDALPSAGGGSGMPSFTQAARLDPLLTRAAVSGVFAQIGASTSLISA